MNRLPRALVTFFCLVTAGCDYFETPKLNTKYVRDGDASLGKLLVISGVHGCTACHAIPGIRFPKGVVGPPLEGMARRTFIAGQLPNSPSVLIAFLEDPPALVPNTGMPNMRLTSEQARHIAAYLYTLD